MNIVSWQKALKHLKEGNANFSADRLSGDWQCSVRRAELTEGQDPFAVILSCADSRVVPEFAFDVGLGELFVIRVAGNIANKSTIASIEYAVSHLNIHLIVVMGHEKCGAITAAIAGGDAGENLNYLLEHINPALAKTTSNDVNTVVKINAELTAKKLVSNSIIIKKAVVNTELKIVSAYYNLSTGKIDFLD